MSPATRLAAAQAVGLPLVGEDLAVDLADTVVTVTDPPTDLLDDPRRTEAFWLLQADRLPPGAAVPTPAATRRLRGAIRELLDATVEGRPPSAGAVADVNAAAAAAPSSARAEPTPDGLVGGRRWHPVHPGDVVLAACADAAIGLVTDPGRRTRLRRCANPQCSMLFEATNPRRVWCTANICGNRARVARHYTRHRS